MNQKQLLQALANMANPEPTNATVLTTYSDIGEPPELCKVFNGGTKAEHIKAYQKAYKFTYGEFQLSTIEELSALLTELENHPRSCVIRGKPLIDNPEIVTRTLHDIPEKGQRQYFEDQKSRWIHIDIDKVKVPNKMGLEELPEYLIDKLPSNFHNVSYHFQHSASAGIKEGVASLHLWFMLSNPMDSVELKEWHEQLSKKQKKYIDESMFRPVQVNYTANPVFIDVDDPVKILRSGLVKKLLPAVTLKTKPKKVKPVIKKTPIQQIRQALTQNKGKPMNAFYKKVKDIGERGHLPILTAFSTYKWACSTKGEQENPQWAIQKVKEQLVGTAYNVPPYNTDNYLNNQYRDAR